MQVYKILYLIVKNLDNYYTSYMNFTHLKKTRDFEKIIK